MQPGCTKLRPYEITDLGNQRHHKYSFELISM